ncbi:MAG: peptidylprolyl isomerase [Bacteroidia bacterium]|nr:peptidylprolyl isomerase [Bacteroidia bacterium]NNJ55776.1 peptidylprolyl isomerase [Bacteroidia bacterium]
MIKIKSIIIICLLFGMNSLFAQNTISIAGMPNDPLPIFSYGDEMVYSDEFLRVFNKNNKEGHEPTKEEIEEYLELYTKFKLKVAEAYDRKMDTIPKFIKELAGYRKQLAQPYLTDKSVTERLIKEAYDRSLMEVNASHLLIACSKDASATDTAIAYNKILGLRSRVVDNNEKFSMLAEQFSDDPSAKTNKGSLGYFTAFQMIYPFENAAFNTEIGSVSMPIRTQFGYHLVYVRDKRKSMGDVKVAHIMMKFYNEGEVDSVKMKMDAVYAKLQAGEEWNKLVEEFSDDFNTNSKGGELNWFNRTTSNMPSEFKDVAYDLKSEGDYSKPIRTKYGWHILKKTGSRELPTFDESKALLKRKVERDSRSEINKEVVIERIKKENKYTEVKGLDAVKGKLKPSLVQGIVERPQITGDVLFTIDNRKYTDESFYDFLDNTVGKTVKTFDQIVVEYYKHFVRDANLEYEEEILEKKYPEFKYIMQEYKDGILLFELTDQEVWSKAVSDSAGLETFYANNIANYKWDERADAIIYSCKNAKTAKKAMKLAKKGVATADIVNKCNQKDALAITSENKKFEKGSNSLLDKIEWKKGVYSLGDENDRTKFVQINEILPPMEKPLDNNLGQATSDYQNYLEQIWIDSLKKKFPLEIYHNNVKKLYN